MMPASTFDTMSENDRCISWLTSMKDETTTSRPLKRKRLLEDCDERCGWDRSATGRFESSARDSTTSQLFACPFFKHDPHRFRSSRSCNSGWPSISRLKEHLTRNHKPLPSCPRCLSTFRTRELLLEHGRGSPCYRPSREPEPDDAQLTEEAYDALSRRTRKGDDPERVWTYLYRLCFPKADTVPSPFYESSEGADQELRQAISAEFLSYFDEVWPSVFDEVARQEELQDAIAHLKARLHDEVKRSMQEFARKFVPRSRQTTPCTDSTVTTRSSASVTTDVFVEGPASELCPTSSSVDLTVAAKPYLPIPTEYSILQLPPPRPFLQDSAYIPDWTPYACEGTKRVSHDGSFGGYYDSILELPTCDVDWTEL